MAKKIKRVELPIDQRETFVSIRRNFENSDMSVKEKLKTLYALQQADSRIDEILQLRGELPIEVEQLEENLTSLKQKSTGISAMIEEFTKSIAVKKQEIVECEATVDGYNSQLENIANSREYDSIMKEIENQGYLKKIAEKVISETKAEIAARKDELAALKDQIAFETEDLKAKKAELGTIIESTAAEEKKLSAEREACAKKIDERTLSAYNRIRESENNKLAVVSVYNGNACGGCFNTIPPQRLIDIASDTKLVICENCGRIIVNPDFD